MTWNRRTVVTLILRVGFGILLVAASADKIRRPLIFAETVANYSVFGQDLSFWAAAWIPFLEAITGLLLIFGLWTAPAALVNLGLMTSFLILVAQACARGLDIRCGCFFAKGESIIGLLKLLENSLLFGAAILLILLVWSRQSRPQAKEMSSGSSTGE